MILFILVLATVLGIGKSKAESIEPSDEQLDIAKYAVHLLKRPCSPQEKKTENVKSFDFEKEISNYASLPCSAEVKKVENMKKWGARNSLSFDVFIDPKMTWSIGKGPLIGKNEVIKCSMEVDHEKEPGPGHLRSQCKIDPPIFTAGTSSEDMMDKELYHVVLFGIEELPFPCNHNTYIGFGKQLIGITIRYPKNCYNIGEEPTQDPPAKEECTIIVDKEKNMTRLRDCKVSEPSDAHLEILKSAIAQIKPNFCSIEIKKFEGMETRFFKQKKNKISHIDGSAVIESPKNCSNSGKGSLPDVYRCSININNESIGAGKKGKVNKKKKRNRITGNCEANVELETND